MADVITWNGEIYLILYYEKCSHNTRQAYISVLIATRQPVGWCIKQRHPV